MTDCETPALTRVISRLKEEFQIIESKGFVKVFHQVRTILDLAGDTPHLLRGSAASSLICYLLGISDIDPLKYNITLARFMNTTRTDYPDIDIDFPHYARDGICLLYTSPSPRDGLLSRMPSSA